MSASQLERLRSSLTPFGLEWTRRTGRPLATARDGMDFLASMKGRDDFWAALAHRDEGQARALDFAARFEQELVHQATQRRSLDETFEVGWRLLERLPRADLSRLGEKAWAWRRAHGGQPS